MTKAEARIVMLFTGKTVLLQNQNHSFLGAKCLEVSRSKMKNKILWNILQLQIFSQTQKELSGFFFYHYITNINCYPWEHIIFSFACGTWTHTTQPRAGHSRA